MSFKGNQHLDRQISREGGSLINDTKFRNSDVIRMSLERNLILARFKHVRELQILVNENVVRKFSLTDEKENLQSYLRVAVRSMA